MNGTISLKTALVAFWFGVLAAPATTLAEPVRVVATFSILGDMVQRIGGDRVMVTTLVGADGDTHVYQPTPADARAISEAQVLIVNGLGFEGWLDRLRDAASFEGLMVTATEGVDVIESAEGVHDKHDEHEEDEHGDEHGHDEHDDEHGHDEHDGEHGDQHGHDEHDDEHGDQHGHHDHGPEDPHAWQSLVSAETYVRNIARGLREVDAGGAAHYARNLEDYLEQLRSLNSEIKAQFATLSEARRTIVTAHDAFAYFGREYGLVFLAPLGFSTEAEASAKDVAQLIEQIRREEISAVFIENFGDPRLVEQIARETGANVGGTLYPGALSGPDGPAATYLDMIRHNANTLFDALDK